MDKKILDTIRDLKEEYEHIPVPPQAKNRVLRELPKENGNGADRAACASSGAALPPAPPQRPV